MPRRIYGNEAHEAILQADLVSGGSETTIRLDTVEGWPVPGTNEIGIGALDFGDQTNIELFSYTGVDAGNNELTGVTRGFDGTTKHAHNSGAVVRHVFSAKDIISAQADADSINTSPGRLLDTSFQPNTDRPVEVLYTVTINCAADEQGQVILKVEDADPPTELWADLMFLADDNNAGNVAMRAELSSRIPPGFWVELVTNNINGSPSYSLNRQTEITL